jgi:hypothetical protein
MGKMALLASFWELMAVRVAQTVTPALKAAKINRMVGSEAILIGYSTISICSG